MWKKQNKKDANSIFRLSRILLLTKAFIEFNLILTMHIKRDNLTATNVLLNLP